MFSNGVVGFLNPDYNSWCCTGFDLRTSNGTPFNFAIMPLQTDLLNYQGRFLTEGTSTYQRYVWENISEFGVPQNLNTFGVEIRPSGYIGMHYEKVNISPWRPVTIGMTGDTSLGEYNQIYHGAGFSSNAAQSYEFNGTGNICLTNPLASHSCPNYAQAYHDQQCSLNALYAPDCAGYEQAYLSQQCSISPLYSTQCAGYQQAYFTQQCNINPLYNSQCNGYAQAYFDQQCRLNPLYDRTCTGYAEAYALANVVPSTSTQSSTTLTVAAPQIVVSTTGSVAVETPVVRDPVVNEVITRPAPTSTRQEPRQEQRQEQKTEEKKEDKKEEKKDTKVEQRRVAIARQIEIATATPTVTTSEVKLYDSGLMQDYTIIQDRLYARMLEKPMQDNVRLNRRMQEDSNILYRELEDGQWRRD